MNFRFPNGADAYATAVQRLPARLRRSDSRTKLIVGGIAALVVLVIGWIVLRALMGSHARVLPASPGPCRRRQARRCDRGRAHPGDGARRIHRAGHRPGRRTVDVGRVQGRRHRPHRRPDLPHRPQALSGGARTGRGDTRQGSGRARRRPERPAPLRCALRAGRGVAAAARPGRRHREGPRRHRPVRSRGGRRRQAESRLHLHPLADRRKDRTDPDPAGQSGDRQRHQPARRRHPDPAGEGLAVPAAERPRPNPDADECGTVARDHSDGWRPRRQRDGQGELRRQCGERTDRHDRIARHLRQHRSASRAGPDGGRRRDDQGFARAPSSFRAMPSISGPTRPSSMS